ncbi:MAG: FKBP-type peptidyl-prolyl cis-trans isomerase [Flavobacteriales bacterium]
MNFRILTATVAVIVLSACSNDVTGQKGGKTNLKSSMDSVSYSIGAQVGKQLKENLRHSEIDSLNNSILAAGLRDALDSTMLFSSALADTVVKAFVMEKQKRMMAAEQLKGEENMKVGDAFMAANGKKPGVITTASGLQYEVLQQGTGPKPLITDTIKVNYRGTTIDGNEFDSSAKHGGPAELPVKDWIAGFVEVFQLMPVGSKYKVYVPSNLAYGAQSAGPGIPAYSTLIFDLELLGIVKK